MSPRLPLIDFLKAFASQLIVWHHLAAYGPLSTGLAEAMPVLASGLYEYARMGVQVFLVMGGFLAVQHFARRDGDASLARTLQEIGQRYGRLVRPFAAALVLAVLANAFAGLWLDDPIVSPWPALSDFLAHLLLLQGLLDVEALSAGVWYVAIDFQLFALTAILFWLGGRHRAVWWMALLALLSLFLFNRDEDWDVWALYFYGAYGMGALVGWQARHPGSLWGYGALLLGVLALWLDFRWRIAVALLTAGLLLAVALERREGAGPADSPGRALGHFLGKISYALFLVHFPVCLAFNALYVALGLTSAASAVVMCVLAWGASLALAVPFHIWLEGGGRASRRPVAGGDQPRSAGFSNSRAAAKSKFSR